MPDPDEDALWCPYHGILAPGVELPPEYYARCGYQGCNSMLYRWGSVNFRASLGDAHLVKVRELPSESLPNLTAIVSQALLDAAVDSQGE